MRNPFRRLGAIGLTIAVSFTALTAGLPSATAAPELSAKSFVAEENASTTIEEAISSALAAGGKPQEIVFVLGTESDPITVGIDVESMDASNEEVAATIRSNLQELREGLEGEPEGLKAVQVAEDQVDKNQIFVDQINGDFTDDQAAGFSRSSPFEPMTPSSTDQTDTSATSASCSEQIWWPRLLTSSAKSITSTSRQNTIAFKWSGTALSYLRCTGSTTFEPDYVTYNYDGRHYFGDGITSWSSNLPNAYRDTMAFDEEGELVYTIGTHDISPLQGDKTYATTFKTPYGNYHNDKAKMVWQRGHYVWGCPSGPAWCIFPDDSEVRWDDWRITVPGYTRWSY